MAKIKLKKEHRSSKKLKKKEILRLDNGQD